MIWSSMGLSLGCVAEWNSMHAMPSPRSTSEAPAFSSTGGRLRFMSFEDEEGLGLGIGR